MINLDLDDLKDEAVANQNIWAELEYGYEYFLQQTKDDDIQEVTVREMTLQMVLVRIKTPNSKIGRWKDEWKDKNKEIYKIVDKRTMGD